MSFREVSPRPNRGRTSRCSRADRPHAKDEVSGAVFLLKSDSTRVRADLDTYVDAVFGCLESEFLTMPKGKGFVEFPAFEEGYEALKQATGSFREVTPDIVGPVVFQTPIALNRSSLHARVHAARVGQLCEPPYRDRGVAGALLAPSTGTSA